MKCVLFLMLSGVLLLLSACEDRRFAEVSEMTGGEPEAGRRAIREYGCAACHTIPGIRGANALVAPSLDGIANRNFIGGVLPNTPENMISWLKSPPVVNPRTAMPDLKLSDEDARNIAAYLYTCR